MALIVCSWVINNLNGFRTLWEPCKFFYTRVFHLEVESTWLLKWTWCKVIGSTVAAVLELAQKPRRPPRGRILHFQATLFLCAVQAFWRNTIKWMYRTQGKGSTHDALYNYLLYAVWHKIQKGFILCCANDALQDSRRSQAIDLLQKPVGQFPFYTASHHPCYTAW